MLVVGSAVGVRVILNCIAYRACFLCRSGWFLFVIDYPVLYSINYFSKSLHGIEQQE